VDFFASIIPRLSKVSTGLEVNLLTQPYSIFNNLLNVEGINSIKITPKNENKICCGNETL